MWSTKGNEFPTPQQHPKMTCSQIDGQQIPVTSAVLPLTVTKVSAEKSQELPGTVLPWFTHCPNSIIGSFDGKSKRGGLC